MEHYPNNIRANRLDKSLKINFQLIFLTSLNIQGTAVEAFNYIL